ncbi:hypothetical protein GC722_16005 [Auraticoccus sp. F435]|uniref:Uncharacterized protein n=1 Tax=Auraticoccus cholistanensis TaxID=2656650 RepID=A0A6A9V1P4_9ACTN|nr:hypothetical protein [Auraticoccus cholistanensis]MVA77507.1 hypothetical protein [Auraticoccus cholistanensis]
MIVHRSSTPDAEFARLDRAAADRFRSLVVDELARRGRPGRIENGVARTGERAYGLENLVRLVAPRPQEEWPALVAHHLDVVDAASEREHPRSTWPRCCRGCAGWRTPSQAPCSGG